MECPPVKVLVDAVEGGEPGAELRRHLGECMACSDVVTALRGETEGLSISVGALWIRERISCPHDDLLLAHLHGDLDADEADFIEFHLKTVECPHCMARSAELETRTPSSPAPSLDRALDESMRRSAAFREQLRG